GFVAMRGVHRVARSYVVCTRQQPERRRGIEVMIQMIPVIVDARKQGFDVATAAVSGHQNIGVAIFDRAAMFRSFDKPAYDMERGDIGDDPESDEVPAETRQVAARNNTEP